LNNTGTVGALFEYAIQLEKDAEKLYRKFAGMFLDHPEVTRFWEHYADEEKGHASYLERIQAGVDADRLSKQADSFIFQKVRQCLEQIAQAKLNEIKTLEDAFNLATELENSETNAVFEFMIVNFSTDELAQSHQFLRTQLSTHIARLEAEFPGPYKSSIARRNIPAE
jgi:rubrerythrin